MTRDREAALRGLLEAVTSILNVPAPAHRGDDDLYLAALVAHIDLVEGSLRGLLAGCLDSVAVQETGRVLNLAAGDCPVSYEAAAS